MNNHTPGPWIVGTEQNMDVFAGKECRENLVCSVAGLINLEGTEQGNLLLIAAAPELLEALKEVVFISDRKHGAWDKAKETIAKAEGKSK
jgi:hypothetical protein